MTGCLGDSTGKKGLRPDKETAFGRIKYEAGLLRDRKCGNSCWSHGWLSKLRGIVGTRRRTWAEPVVL
jgi:hypothetical protein